MGDLRATLDASNELLERADALSARLLPEGGGAASGGGGSFDVDDYRATALQVTEAALQLERVVLAVERLVGAEGLDAADGAPLVAALTHATAVVDERVDHAFRRALVLIAAAGVTALVVALAYRALAPRVA